MKERIERKRHNDGIRVLEFNQLRDILQKGKGIRRSDGDEAPVASSLVRTSGIGTMERNSILDKIDGAEAHLEHWWGKPTTPDPIAPAPLPRAQRVAPTRQDAPQLPSGTGNAAFIDDLELDFTDMLALQPSEPPVLEPETVPIALREAKEVVLSALEVCLRDAALHFAEGEFSDAHDLLSNRLRDPAIADDETELLTFTLFDLYRCTGQQDRFDALALDYANRFGRSPGEWFSLVGNASTPGSPPLPEHPAEAEDSEETTWQCPDILDQAALADCIAHASGTSSTCHINWAGLQHIDEATAPALANQLKVWIHQAVELHWSGIDALLAALQMCKVSGDAARNAAWWLIQLDVLCILQQAEAYEEMALDYCVEFEVSPPSWQVARCKLVQDSEFDSPPEFAATSNSKEFEEGPANQSGYAVYALCGNLTGEARRALRELRAASHAASQITVSCANLGRIDFTAASALLNWAAQCSAKGCQVQFIHLPRLVLVFLQMLGMPKVASLSTGAH